MLYDGLLRELNPGPLAPGARIIPLDQAAVATLWGSPPCCERRLRIVVIIARLTVCAKLGQACARMCGWCACEHKCLLLARVGAG